MFVGLHGGEFVVEDLVFVVVYQDVLGVIVRGAEEAVPGLRGGEAVVEDDGGVADLADGVEAVAVVLFGRTAATGDVGEQGFVEELDGDDDVLVGGDGVFAGDLGEDAVGEGGGVAGCPLGSAGSLAGIVETILGEWRSCWKISLMWQGRKFTSSVPCRSIQTLRPVWRAHPMALSR